MRELLGVLLAVILITVGVTAGQDRIREYVAARAATSAAASMGAFVAAARDHLDSQYAALAARAPGLGDVTHIGPAALRAAGLLPPAWIDNLGIGQQHVLAVRRTAADSLTALAYTYGGQGLGERAMILAARGGPTGLGIMSAEFGADVVSITNDWQVQRADYNTDPRFPILDGPDGNGRLAALLFAHRGRVLGPWICRAEVPARPECNEMTAALRIAPTSLVDPDSAALEVAFGTGRALDVTGDARLGGAVGIRRLPAAGSALSVAGDAAITGELRVAATIRARNYVQTSDPRAKTGLAAVICTPALRASLDRIQLHRWTWKTGGRPGIGYDANDVARMFPDLVERNADGLRQIDYNALSVLKQECGGPVQRGACPAGRFRLTHWGPAPLTVPESPAGHILDLSGPARGFLECPRVRAICNPDRAGQQGWHFACAPAAGLAFRPEPAVHLSMKQE